MTYTEGKRMIRASNSFEGVNPVAIADMLSHAQSVVDPDPLDVRVAACAAYELAKLGCTRVLFWQLLRD